ncbi:MAG: 2-dehydropantoate 2-reductase [Anaerolineales bacterium]|nr:2-dehydropantoate 2-reductase [Anaerolineales bacterium]
MRIIVFGAGGVGGYFGGRLAQAGEEVIFIARGEHMQAMRSHGLRVDSIKGDFHIDPVQVADDPGQVGAADIILAAVKAWQVPEIAPAMAPMLGAETGVIFLGNGVEAPGQLSAALGSQHVLGGLCRISAFVAAPGHIRHAGIQPYVAFAELDGRRSPRVERLREAFERAGVEVSVPDDIQAAVWQKFVFIAAISGVGAVTRAPAGVIRSLPETRRMLEMALEEVVRVAQARQVHLPAGLVARTMAFVDSMAPGVTASMQRDIMDGKPSELESQNGAVVRMGQQAGVETPLHAFIYHSLIPQEMKARGQVEF